jgi:hypothetical protein
MEPAKFWETDRDSRQAAATGSAANPASGKAPYRTTLDRLRELANDVPAVVR